MKLRDYQKKDGKKNDANEPTDAEILDWLQSLMKRKGRWVKLVFSDSRDMGYKQDFLSYWSEGGVDGPTRKGNSVREVLSKQMAGAGWKRSLAKPRQSPNGKQDVTEK